MSKVLSAPILFHFMSLTQLQMDQSNCGKRQSFLICILQAFSVPQIGLSHRELKDLTEYHVQAGQRNHLK